MSGHQDAAESERRSADDSATGTPSRGNSSPLLPDADPEPTEASKYSTTEEEVVTDEDRDPGDRGD